MKNFYLILLLILITGAPVFAQTSDVELNFKLGNERLEEKDYDGAIIAYSECLRLSPRQSACYFNRGIAYELKSNFNQAIADYTEAIKYSSNIDKYYYWRGRVYFNDTKHDLAIADFTEAIKIDSNNATYYKWRADAYFEIKKFDLVVADLKTAVKLKPEDEQLKKLLEIATKIDEKTKAMAEDVRKLEAGKRILGDAVPGELSAQSADEFFKRGKEQYEKKENAAAIESFSECLRLKPDFADCYFYRGEVYNRESQYEKAVADFTEAIKLQPQKVEYYRSRATINDFLFDKYDAAIADFNEIIKLEPKVSTWYLSRGYIFVKKKDYQKALNDFTQAINLESSVGSKKVYYRARAGLYDDHLKNYEASIADLTEIIKIDPTDWMDYANRGFLYLKIKNYEQAVADYTEALKLGATLTASMYEYRARAYCGLGKRSLAMADEQKVIEAGSKVEFPCHQIR